MRGTLTILKVDGSTETKELTSAIGNLDIYQAAVGGLIQIVPGITQYEDKPAVVFCNDEGKLHGLAYNEAATVLWARAYDMPVEALSDFIVGDIAIVTGDADFMAAL